MFSAGADQFQQPHAFVGQLRDLLTARIEIGPRLGQASGKSGGGLVDGRAAIAGRLVLTLRGRLLADAVVRRLLP